MPHPELEILLQLQELDAEASRMQAEIDRYPSLCKAQEDEVGRSRQKHADALQRRKDLELEIRQFERDADSWHETLNKLSAQQFNVKNQKEYDAIGHQMDDLRTKISVAEEKGLAFLTEEERLDGEIATLFKAIAARQERAEQEIARLNERKQEKEALLTRIRNHRAEVVEGLNPETLKKYETLFQQHHGTALAQVRDGNCGGCNMGLIPKTRQSLSRPDELTQCDSCRRFLYL